MPRAGRTSRPTVGIVARQATRNRSLGKSRPTHGELKAIADPMFIMKYDTNSMEASTSTQEKVWFVDSGASNHITNHEEWFESLKKLEKSRFMETRADTVHTIEHIGDVPLSHVG